jgi:DNA-binding YbaB/EbfC family protein
VAKQQRGGMQQMLAQVQKMQRQMQEAQEQLANETVEATAGGGMVTVTVGGDLTVRNLHIDPAAIDPDDAQMLADIVLAAVNEGLRKAQELAARKLDVASGGLDLGELGNLGGLGLPGL